MRVHARLATPTVPCERGRRPWSRERPHVPSSIHALSAGHPRAGARGNLWLGRPRALGWQDARRPPMWAPSQAGGRGVRGVVEPPLRPLHGPHELLPLPHASGGGEGPWFRFTPTGPAPTRAAHRRRRRARPRILRTLHATPRTIPANAQWHLARHSALRPRTRSRLRPVVRRAVALVQPPRHPAARALRVRPRDRLRAFVAVTSARMAPGGTTMWLRLVRGAPLRGMAPSALPTPLREASSADAPSHPCFLALRADDPPLARGAQYRRPSDPCAHRVHTGLDCGCRRGSEPFPLPPAVGAAWRGRGPVQRGVPARAPAAGGRAGGGVECGSGGGESSAAAGEWRHGRWSGARLHAAGGCPSPCAGAGGGEAAAPGLRCCNGHRALRARAQGCGSRAGLARLRAKRDLRSSWRPPAAAPGRCAAPWSPGGGACAQSGPRTGERGGAGRGGYG